MSDQTQEGSGKAHSEGLSFPFAGVKDRKTGQVSAEVVDNTDQDTLQKFVVRHVEGSATVYSDGAQAYAGPPFPQKTAQYSVSEMNAIYQMGNVVMRMQGRHLKYAGLAE